ncbi:MAG: hypothetical protein J2P17_31100 [Mycobacterium sp.]|nr:hypothetical protein [Mycobacterium sp.]
MNRPGFDDPGQAQRYGDFLCGIWASACDVFDLPAGHAARITGELRRLLPSWADDEIGDSPSFRSYVAGDGFPAELSVNWSGHRPELRVLFDCLPDARSGYHHTPADHSGTAELRAASPRFREIDRHFTLAAGRPSAAPLWHSIAWRPPAQPAHKTYFGLFEWPIPYRYAAVADAMEQLGMAAAWEHARRWIERDGGRPWEIEFVGLDLASASDARVKIYYRNHDADIHELNRIASVARTHDANDALAAFRTLTGGQDDAGEAALTCLAFRSGLERVAEATTYLRLPSLASSDQESVDRTAALLDQVHRDARPLRTFAAALAPVRLDDSRGFLELVSYRAAHQRGDITTYFRFPVFERLAAAESVASVASADLV